jgi:glycogen debranching enzyme
MAVALVRPEILYAWAGPSLLITNPRGDCDSDQPLSGFYYREARVLRALRLDINGERPWLCEAASVSPDTLAFNYVHPEITEPGGGGTGQADDEEHTDKHGLPERSLDMRVTYRVRVGGLDVSLTLANRAMRSLSAQLAWHVDADFADIQEAQAGRRQQQALVRAEADGDGVVFSYEHASVPLVARVRGGGWTARRDRLVTRVALEPQQELTLMLRVEGHTGSEHLTPEQECEREAALDAWRGRFTRVEAPGNRVAERVIAGNIRDIGSFPLASGPRDEWLVPQAGMPLYPAFFGRDAVTAGWMTGMLDRGDSLDAALTRLGRMQSNRTDDWRDEQPGRIPYQVRTGPLALLNINPYSAYYADYASPLMYVIALANLWAWTGDIPRVRAHWDTARRILEWARRYGDADGDGYLEYHTRSSKGTKNQGWKDSGDAIVYDDGTPVPAPIATCELQGYWYLAQELMGLLSLAMRATADAKAYHESAAALKERFNRDWWVEDEQFFALALDPEKRRVRAVTSNVGHCLATGIIDGEHLPRVVGRMFAPDLFSGWGIRTLSSSHAFYNPLSYHRGTVWGVEQATIVFGLRRFGFDARAVDLAAAQFDLARLYPDDRIPECVGGYARGERPVPGAYPRANTPQLWNATAFPLMLQALLGILPLAPLQTLIVDPALPSWLPDVIVRGLRVGEATAALRFWRDDRGRSKWEVLHKRGTLHVVRQPAPQSLSSTALDRAAALIESVAS